MNETLQEQSPTAVAEQPNEGDPVVHEAFAARAEALESIEETRQRLGGGVAVDPRGQVVSVASEKKEAEFRQENNGATSDETATKI